MRWNVLQIFGAILLTALWSVPMYFLNAFGEAVILGDQCQYHSEGTSALFDVFYNLPGWNGYHPSPTAFNLIVTVFIPAVYLALRSAKRVFAGKSVTCNEFEQQTTKPTPKEII